jgi:SAM-dependent methyltransferase
MSKEDLETWDIGALGWRVEYNRRYNADWIASNKLNAAPRSLQLLKDEGLDISDSQHHEVGWLRNIDRLIDMMPPNFIPSDYDLLDVGCGAGISTLYFASNYPFNSCTGIDFSPSLIQIASENSDSHGTLSRTKFLVADASDYLISSSGSGLFLFLFNPFGYQTASMFIKNNIQVLRQKKAVMAFAWDTWIHQFASEGMHQKIVRNAYYKLSLIFF